ncbi:MAG: NADH-quinone oxidoreductase subunit M [Methylococcaceae bacterium]|nr:MAG: NADH-quinone oxidoreductase subunit M [Methylococcaceae bacterium]
MPAIDFPILTTLILLPLLGSVPALLSRPAIAYKIAMVIGCVELLLSLVPLLELDAGNPNPQLLERYAWIPSLHADFLLGVDGISALFLPLSALLGLMAVAASRHAVSQQAALYYALLLALQGITQGVFCALDLLAFFLFWELTLVPLYFLISLWGIGPQRRFAASQYVLLMLAGGVPLLFAILLLALNHAEAHGLTAMAGLSFDYLELLETPMPASLQSTVFLLLLAGFAVKAPLFPFHVWLPRVSMEGPAAVSALLVGLKLGAYGLLRFAIPLAPLGAQQHMHWLSLAAALGIIYGALLALAQTNLRRMLAFAGISHVGYVVLGLSALNLQGAQGALLQLLGFTVTAAGLFLLTGFLHQRTGTTELASLGGLAQTMPRFATLFFILGLSSMGVPGTQGFAAEYLIVLGALRADIGLGFIALVGTILGAAYFLGACRRALFGPLRNRLVMELADLRPGELRIAVTLVLLALLGGLFPQVLLDINASALQQWVKRNCPAALNVPPLTRVND